MGCGSGQHLDSHGASVSGAVFQHRPVIADYVDEHQAFSASQRQHMTLSGAIFQHRPVTANRINDKVLHCSTIYVFGVTDVAGRQFTASACTYQGHRTSVASVIMMLTITSAAQH